MKNKVIDIQPYSPPNQLSSDKYLVWHIQGGLGNKIDGNTIAFIKF